MKRIAKIFVAVALIVFSLLLVACNGSDSPDSIYFTKEHTPKQTYVLGQELNFANTLLTVETNGTTETVAMDADGVTVSGYDKDKLGEQTVTVSYKDKTTTFSPA